MKKSVKELLEENSRLEKQLAPENQQVLTDIVAYLRGSSAPTDRQEQVRRDILNMLLEGERRGQSARQVLGEDVHAFCDEILAALPRRSAGQQAIYSLSVVSLSAAMLAVIWLVFSLFTAAVQGAFSLLLPVTAGQLLSGLLIAALSYGLVQLICRTSFDAQGRAARWITAALFTGMAAVVLLCLLLTAPLFYLHAGLAAALIAGLYLTYKITDRMAN